ncbi:hypothetical protein ACH5RR_011286 [Cinchona calisaya]|uniref:Sulfotransferase n=1 Tax=Cinchona calisaya TaxID=153742 RepID=A0ABD3A7W0_9GENT
MATGRKSFTYDEFPEDPDDLPKEKYWGTIDLYRWEGFWCRFYWHQAIIAAKSCFLAQDDDVILASPSKAGSTWLKALIPSIMMSNNNTDDPLLENHPNDLMPSLEFEVFNINSNYNASNMASSPRLFRTHIPYFALSDSIKKSGCKIVYITRDPKDVFVSLWYFMNTKRKPDTDPYPSEEAFDSFCRGVHAYGPFHDHVLGYWNESLERPEKILFLRYEEMKKDPRKEVTKLASFLGRPFANVDEVDEVLGRCSLERLKSLEMNKDGIDPWSELQGVLISGVV